MPESAHHHGSCIQAPNPQQLGGGGRSWGGGGRSPSGGRLQQASVAAAGSCDWELRSKELAARVTAVTAPGSGKGRPAAPLGGSAAFAAPVTCQQLGRCALTPALSCCMGRVPWHPSHRRPSTTTCASSPSLTSPPPPARAPGAPRRKLRGLARQATPGRGPEGPSTTIAPRGRWQAAGLPAAHAGGGGAQHGTFM